MMLSDPASTSCSSCASRRRSATRAPFARRLRVEALPLGPGAHGPGAVQRRPHGQPATPGAQDGRGHQQDVRGPGRLADPDEDRHAPEGDGEPTPPPTPGQQPTQVEQGQPEEEQGAHQVPGRQPQERGRGPGDRDDEGDRERVNTADREGRHGDPGAGQLGGGVRHRPEQGLGRGQGADGEREEEVPGPGEPVRGPGPLAERSLRRRGDRALVAEQAERPACLREGLAAGLGDAREHRLGPAPVAVKELGRGGRLDDHPAEPVDEDVVHLDDDATPLPQDRALHEHRRLVPAPLRRGARGPLPLQRVPQPPPEPQAASPTASPNSRSGSKSVPRASPA